VQLEHCQIIIEGALAKQIDEWPDISPRFSVTATVTLAA
jgi:hypothetical protein